MFLDNKFNTQHSKFNIRTKCDNSKLITFIMHIIQIITELKPAGAERILANLSICLKEKGCDVTVISLKTLPENRAIVDELFSFNIPILSLNLTKLKPWKMLKLNKLISKISHEPRTTNHQSFSTQNLKLKTNIIIHSHLMHANLICRLNKKMGGKFKLLNTIHIAEKRKNRSWYFMLDKLAINQSDHINAVSKAARNYHSSKLNIDHGKISIVYNGIKTPKQLNKDEIVHLKKEWGMNECSKIIGSVGRLDWQKGYDIFLKLLPKLSKNIPKDETWGVVILGEGYQRNLLEKFAGKAPGNIKVTLPGYRKDASDCISAFDLFVMPSRYEGFGLTLIEAVSQGVPIVASNEDSLPELMYNYVNGICVSNDDQTEIIKLILKYINKSRIAPSNNFTIEKMTEEYLKIYKKL